MTYLLDTCVISELVTKQPNLDVLRWIDNQAESELYLSVITFGEIAKGINKLPESSRRTDLMMWLTQTLPQRFSQRILNIDRLMMLEWGELIATSEKQGRRLPVMDSLIAAICLHHSLTLVTRNEKDFLGTEVQILNPWRTVT